MTFASEPAPAPIYAPPPARPKRKAWKIVLIIAAAVLALIVIAVVGLVLLVSGATKDAQKVSDRFVVAVQTGDAAGAYALTGSSFRAATTEADMTQLVNQLSTLVTKDKVSPTGKAINASTDSGKVAVFTYKLKGAGRGPVYLKTEIRDEDGGWKVLNLRSSESPLNTDVE
jgi:hypothetical protein